MRSEAFLSLLQFGDGLFPAGSYAHSYGLETCVSDGTVRDAKGVSDFLEALLRNTVAPADGVAILCAAKASRAGNVEQCLQIDQMLNAMKSARELREASLQMGRQVLRIAASVNPDAMTASIYRAVENGSTPGHHAMAFGLVGASMEWPDRELICSYLYSTCAGLVAAALRLLPLGQLAGQGILWGMQPVIAGLADSVIATRDMADIWSFAPMLEIASMRHENLEARLFRS